MHPSSSNRSAKISGKMHLLDRSDYTLQGTDTLLQVLTDVYNNFVSMANVIKHAAFGYQTCWIFPIFTHTSLNLTTRIWELKYLMGFIRCALKWCVSDGGVINRSLVDILTSIEVEFIEVSQLHLSSPSSDESVLLGNHGDEGFDLNFSEQKILDAYLFIWKNCVPSASMFTEVSVMERLDQAMKNDMKHKKQSVVMKKFIHFIKESTDQASLEEILPWVDYLLDMMMCYFFHSNMIIEPYSDITSRLDAAIDCIVLHILVWHSESRPPFTDELLVAYVECIQQNLFQLLKQEHYCLAEQIRHRIVVIKDVLRLVISLVSDMPKYEFDLQKLCADTEMKQLGCIISSLFAFEFNREKVSFQITHWLLRTIQALCLLLDSDGPLATDTLFQYVYCFQHYWFLVHTGEGTDTECPPQNQSKFAKDLVYMTHVVFYNWSEYHIEREILLNGRIEMVGVLKVLGSIISSSLNNEVEKKTRIEMNSGLPELLLKFERVKELTKMIFVKIFIGSTLQAPQTDPLGFLSFFLENLEELRDYNFDLIRDWKDQLQIIQGNLVVFRSFLQKHRDKSIRSNSARHLSIRIRNAVYDAEYIINAFAAGAFHIWSRSVLISDLIEQFNIIKEEVNTVEFFIEVSSDVLQHESILTTIPEKLAVHASSQVSSVPPIDVVVGFEVEMKLLMERLASDKEHVDVISVVGMPGIGKTTLAKKAYGDPYMVNHFQLRAWCVVSHDYDKKELLVRILGADGIPEASFEELGVVLHKKLMGRRYLIILDDVWDIDAFFCLKRFFPKDDNGSRIVLTSRAILMGRDSNPIKLHLLSDDGSWNMLKEKVYPRKEFPVELIQIGKRIAKKCGGLPLAVAVVAGLLAKSDKDKDVWKKIAGRLSIYSAADDSQGQGMKVLDLSYELLPDYLKPLFLYVGAFPEDESISTKKLKWLWIGEGFIRKSEVMSQEDQAETYLMDLIDRSLLMVGERKSNGLVKTCRIHDLMRDMALSKAQGEDFLQCIGNVKQLPVHVIFERRVCVYSYEGTAALVASDETPLQQPPITYGDLSALSMPSCLNSVLFFHRRGSLWDQNESIFENHKLLRVFHMDSYDELEFSGVTLPVHLRYISFYIGSSRILSSIFSLLDLETLNLKWSGRDEIRVPGEVWKMTKLRNLHISCYGSSFTFSEAGEECGGRLENLQTLSTPVLNGSSEDTALIGRLPNLVKLKCVFSNKGRIISEWPRLEYLHQLQSLKVRWWGGECIHPQFSLPSTLKKLSLFEFRLKWKDISIFQQLPELQILKLQTRSVVDEVWDMGNVVVFPKLKFLELHCLDIKRWIASDENFPCLANLVLTSCWYLEEIPCSFGDICSLEKIQLEGCSDSASESAKQIQQVQLEEFGNDFLNVHVTNPCSSPLTLKGI